MEDEAVVGSTDFLSADFDPEAALADPNTVSLYFQCFRQLILNVQRPPVPDAPVMDNVNMCKKLLPNYEAPTSRKSEASMAKHRR